MKERQRPPLRARFISGVSLIGAAVLACNGNGKDENGANQQPFQSPTATREIPTPIIRTATVIVTPRVEVTSPPAVPQVSPTARTEVNPTVTSSFINRVLRLDGNVDSVEYDGEKFNFQAPLRIDARIRITESALNIGGNAILARGENDAIAFFSSLTSCPERGMALIIDGKEPVCGPRVQTGVWKEVSAVFDGENVIFSQDGSEAPPKQWKGSIPITRDKLFVGKSPSGFLAQEFFGGDIDYIRVINLRTGQVLFGPTFDSDFRDPISGEDGVLRGDAKLVSAN